MKTYLRHPRQYLGQLRAVIMAAPRLTISYVTLSTLATLVQVLSAAALGVFVTIVTAPPSYEPSIPFAWIWQSASNKTTIAIVGLGSILLLLSAAVVKLGAESSLARTSSRISQAEAQELVTTVASNPTSNQQPQEAMSGTLVLISIENQRFISNVLRSLVSLIAILVITTALLAIGRLLGLAILIISASILPLIRLTAFQSRKLHESRRILRKVARETIGEILGDDSCEAPKVRRKLSSILAQLLSCIAKPQVLAARVNLFTTMALAVVVASITVVVLLSESFLPLSALVTIVLLLRWNIDYLGQFGEATTNSARYWTTRIVLQKTLESIDSTHLGEFLASSGLGDTEE